jgi:hypothetical protein
VLIKYNIVLLLTIKYNIVFYLATSEWHNLLPFQIRNILYWSVLRLDLTLERWVASRRLWDCLQMGLSHAMVRHEGRR